MRAWSSRRDARATRGRPGHGRRARGRLRRLVAGRLSGARLVKWSETDVRRLYEEVRHLRALALELARCVPKDVWLARAPSTDRAWLEVRKDADGRP